MFPRQNNVVVEDFGAGYRHPIDACAVGAALVVENVVAAFDIDLGVTARHAQVFDDNIGLTRAPNDELVSVDHDSLDFLLREFDDDLRHGSTLFREESAISDCPENPIFPRQITTLPPTAPHKSGGRWAKEWPKSVQCRCRRSPEPNPARGGLRGVGATSCRPP